jgi:hypothetical protein
LLLVILAAGCTDTSGVGKTYPVSGKVTLDDKPLTGAMTLLLFKPDTAKGNTSLFEPSGQADDQGNYTLVTRGKSGAPPGWYKVIVTATTLPKEEGKRSPGRKSSGVKSLLSPRYGQASTTPISIEVVESPADGAYDIKLTGK